MKIFELDNSVFPPAPLSNQFGLYSRYMLMFKNPFSPSTLYGWQLTSSNTGLSNPGLLQAFNLSGADAGKGEWIGGTGVRLWLYSNNTFENRTFTYSNSLIATEGNYIFRNCLFRPTSLAAGASLVSAVNAQFYNCEIDGSLIPDSNIMHPGLSLSNGIVQYCYIHGNAGAIMLDSSSGSSLIDSNYMTDIRYQPDSMDHLVGISIWQSIGNGITISNNRIELNVEGTEGHQTGAFYSTSYHNAISNVSFINNLLISSSYVIHLVDSGYLTSNPYTFNNNRLVLIPGDYAWGYYANTSSATPTWTNNKSYPSLNDAINDTNGSPV